MGSNLSMVQDPVCEMSFAEPNANGRVKYRQTVYLICSVGCETAFLESPEKYSSNSGLLTCPPRSGPVLN